MTPLGIGASGGQYGQGVGGWRRKGEGRTAAWRAALLALRWSSSLLMRLSTRCRRAETDCTGETKRRAPRGQLACCSLLRVAVRSEGRRSSLAPLPHEASLGSLARPPGSCGGPTRQVRARLPLRRRQHPRAASRPGHGVVGRNCSSGITTTCEKLRRLGEGAGERASRARPCAATAVVTTVFASSRVSVVACSC